MCEGKCTCLLWFCCTIFWVALLFIYIWRLSVALVEVYWRCARQVLGEPQDTVYYSAWGREWQLVSHRLASDGLPDVYLLTAVQKRLNTNTRDVYSLVSHPVTWTYTAVCIWPMDWCVCVCTQGGVGTMLFSTASGGSYSKGHVRPLPS